MSQYFSNDKLSVYSKHMTLQALLNTCENKMMFKMIGKRLNLLLPEVFVYYSLKLSCRSTMIPFDYYIDVNIHIPDSHFAP